MLIAEHFARSGQTLFRWRSYVPLVILPFILWAAWSGGDLSARFGQGWGDLVETLALLMVIGGEAVRIGTVGFVPKDTSGRNTQGQLAGSLNTTGAYSLVRNPLYLGNCLMYVGVALFTQDLVLTLVVALALLPYYERIIAGEEAFLAESFGQPYRDWAAEVPAFLPRRHGWKAPALDFSLKAVIRREQASILGAGLVLYVLKLLSHRAGGPDDHMSALWHVGAAALVLAYLWARYAKTVKRSLQDGGR